MERCEDQCISVAAGFIMGQCIAMSGGWPTEPSKFAYSFGGTQVRGKTGDEFRGYRTQASSLVRRRGDQASRGPLLHLLRQQPLRLPNHQPVCRRRNLGRLYSGQFWRTVWNPQLLFQPFKEAALSRSLGDYPNHRGEWEYCIRHPKPVPSLQVHGRRPGGMGLGKVR